MSSMDVTNQTKETLRLMFLENKRFDDRIIRDSDIIEFSKLVINPKKKVWNLYIDIYPINDDGSLIDAATIATVAALHKTFVPELDSEGRVDYDKKSKE